MKYMGFVIPAKPMEQTGPPPQALMDAMGKYIEESFKSGVLIDTGGLAPANESTRVAISGGKLNVTDGPFTETKELVGGYAILNCGSKEQAIEVSKQFMQLHIDNWPGWEGASEIRQIFGMDD
jgi:hypothetical protein